MGRQLGFGGFGPSRRPRDRLILALRPSPMAARRFADRAMRLRGEHRLESWPMALERFHVTLHGFDVRAGVPADLVGSIKAALSTFRAEAFDAAFDIAASFTHRDDRRPLVMLPRDDEALARFRSRLVGQLSDHGLGSAEEGPYQPHVTLLYDKAVVEPQALEPVRWRVVDFVLIHSHVGLTRHDELGRWALG